MNPLDEARLRVLDLHRALLAVEREDYERLHGRVTAAVFLEALMREPEHAWLRPLTKLILELDEILEWKEPLGSRARVEGVRLIRELLSPDENGNEFQRRYADALQQSPDVVLAHAAVLKTL